VIDAAAALQCMTGEQVLTLLGRSHRYHRRVFLAPPWPEIYVVDPERRHEFDAALVEYARLIESYPALGYDVVVLPKVGVRERADFVLDVLAH
jgi:predicted ATPase